MDSDASNVFTFLREEVPLWIRSLEPFSLGSVTCLSSCKGFNSSLDTVESHTEIVHLKNGELQKLVVAPGTEDEDSETYSSFNGRPDQPVPSMNSDGAPPLKKDPCTACDITAIHYNSAEQKSLENIVDGIGIAKYMIRRIISKQPASKSPTPGDSDTEDEPDEAILLSRVRMRGAESSGSNPQAHNDAREKEALETALQNLEIVQDFCNRCAFQLLRGGSGHADAIEAIEVLETVLEDARYGIATSKADEIVEMLKSSAEKMHSMALYTESYLKPNRYERELIPLPIKLTYRLNGYLGI